MKVSILIITYNHERFIAQTIESVLMQQTDFDYELVIGEDCSKDSTREIVIGYQRRYPDKIRLLLNEKNMGIIPNLVQTFKACKGQYIALCEGDDYWTNPLKLQKQVDCLDKHDNIAICCHNVQDIYEEGLDESPYLPKGSIPESIFTVEDLIAKGWFIRTSSLMFRNLREQLPDWFRDEKSQHGDFMLQLIHAAGGDIYYLSEVMSVYRMHPGSVTFLHTRGKVKDTGIWDKNMIFVWNTNHIYF